MPRRRPPDLTDTLDEGERAFGLTEAMEAELDQPRARTGPVIRFEPADLADSEWGQALRAEVDALKATRAEDAMRADRAEGRAAHADKWMSRGGKALSVIAASAIAALTYAFAIARSDADAKATTREREAQRIDVYGIVRRLDRESAAVIERLGSIERALARFPIGFVPVQGPPPSPSPQEPP